MILDGIKLEIQKVDLSKSDRILIDKTVRGIRSKYQIMDLSNQAVINKEIQGIRAIGKADAFNAKKFLAKSKISGILEDHRENLEKAGTLREFIDGLNNEVEGIRARTEHELNTIINMGFPDYFLIVQDFLDVGRRMGHMPEDRFNYLREHIDEMSISEMNAYIDADQSAPGMTIGPGRGSAAGSIVAYALGITNIDPIKNDLLFERFLNPERVSMPDIDSDLSKSQFEYGVRDMVITYCTKKYGENALCGIATPSTMAARAAVVNVARILGSRKKIEEKVSKGSQAETAITKQYLRYADKINDCIPEDPNASFQMDMGGETLENVLRKKFDGEHEMLDIIDMAVKAEGLNINFGMHACGKIIYPGDVRDAGAMMLDPESGIWKIQMDAEQAEASGLLKMDFLGLKNLNIITKTVRLIMENSGKYVDCDKIPEDPAVYREIFATAKTQAVFQFESQGMKNMLKRFKPERFSDIVLLVACFRPGPLQYLDGIIERKNFPNAAGNSGVLMEIPEIQSIIAPTYSAIVYQEQVQQIFRTLAGYSLGQADLVRRAMGHKKMDVLQAEREAFLHGDVKRGIVGCEKNGINVANADRLFDEMMEFAKYAFNKSHAAAYARTSYITAYLKFHYPTEFYTAALNFTDIAKYPELIEEAKSFGVHVHGPNVNLSRDTFTGRDGDIYFGISGIKGIGEGTEIDVRNAESIADFMIRSELNDSVIRKIAECGGFDSFVGNRQAFLNVIEDYFEERKTIRAEQKKIDTFNAMIADLADGKPLDREKWKIKTKSLPDKPKLEKKIEASAKKINDAVDMMRSITIPTTLIPDDLERNLELEKQYLGMYASGHPLDQYGYPADFNCTPASELQEGTNASVFGFIRDIRCIETKKDHLPMAFLTLEDQTGMIPVVVFPKSFQNNEPDKFRVGEVIKVEGRVETRNEKLQLIAKNDHHSLDLVNDRKGDVFVPLDGIENWAELKARLSEYIVPVGHPLKVYNTVTGETERTTYRVHQRILLSDMRAKLING